MSTPEQDLMISHAAVRTRQLADTLHSPEAILQDADILAASRWGNHQIDAGWLYMHAFKQLRWERQRHRTDLVGKARSTWSSVLDKSGVVLTGELLRAKFAHSYSGAWVQSVNGRLSWDHGFRQQGIDQLRELEAFMADPLRTYPRKHESPRDMTGVLSEIVAADTLTRLAIAAGSNTVTIPAEPWYDARHADPANNFDLWQVTETGWRKLQVKSSHRATDRGHSYAPDIAVVVLEDHWPVENIWSMVSTLHATEVGDRDVLGVGSSMQHSIDEHFKALAAA